VAVKHRQLARQVWVFIEHPPKNSMASFSFTSTMLNEGTMFIFGSWFCVANGSGGFNGHLADSKNPEASTPSRCSDLDKFVDSLDELVLPDHAGEIETTSAFDTTSTRAAPGLLGLDSNRSDEATRSESLSDLQEDLDHLLKLGDEGAITYRGGPVSDNYSGSEKKYSSTSTTPSSRTSGGLKDEGATTC
jgi:hypothetical protein